MFVDSANIETNRRKRRVKADSLDVDSLVRMLIRYDYGETKVCSMLRVPTKEEEDRRQLHRGLSALNKERNRTINRILVGFYKRVEIAVSEGLPFVFSADERRVANDEIRLRPFRRCYAFIGFINYDGCFIRYLSACYGVGFVRFAIPAGNGFEGNMPFGGHVRGARARPDAPRLLR